MTSNKQKFDRFSVEAIQFMSEHEITPRPENYRVWFEYAAGSTPALNNAVEKLGEEDRRLDEEISVRLHNEFFNHGIELTNAVEDTGHALSEKLTGALELIATAGKGTKAYGVALESISTNLGSKSEGELAQGGLQTIVETLAVATQEMSSHTKSLEAKLQDNTREVEELRNNLEKAKAEAITDQLTKLGNRKHFDIELAKAAQHSEETGDPLCLIMSDIDKFKIFNDTWGHQTGDQVLRLVAACLKKEVRDNHIPARYGGEEFGLILPMSDIEKAIGVAEQVRASVESKKVVKRSTGEDLGTITISLGIALYRPGEAIATLIERADACLYEAKEAGRNCVISESSDTQAKVAS